MNLNTKLGRFMRPSFRTFLKKARSRWLRRKANRNPETEVTGKKFNGYAD